MYSNYPIPRHLITGLIPKQGTRQNEKSWIIINIKFLIFTLKSVVYFDQYLGAAHSKHCLKYAF